VFAYIVRRIGGTLIVLFGISIVTFLLIYAIPADPARMIVGPKAPMSVVEAVRAQLGLNLPLPLRYLHYVWRLLHGDLGTSYIYNQPVLTMIAQRFGPTALLALLAWLSEVIIGIPLGIYTAQRARKVGDYIISAIAVVGLSLPVYWLGLVLLYWFAFKTRVFPLGGSMNFQAFILPALTYGIVGFAYYQRLLKSSMLEVMSQDYVRTARAKGASEGRIIRRHVLRNALIPVVTFGGIDISYLLGGVVLIETTFNINGIGTLAYQAITNIDIPVIMGTVMLTAVIVVLFTLLVDILYAFIDPRIRY
jgi:ABC-type dipeptide/oligopeptide/nickel transport system permease component